MKDAVVPRLDLNISNGSDDAGKRGRLGINQVDAACSQKGIPRGVHHHVFKVFQLSRLLVVEVVVAKKRSDRSRGAP